MNFELIEAFWRKFVSVNSAITGSGIWLLCTRPGEKNITCSEPDEFIVSWIFRNKFWVQFKSN